MSALQHMAQSPRPGRQGSTLMRRPVVQRPAGGAALPLLLLTVPQQQPQRQPQPQQPPRRVRRRSSVLRHQRPAPTPPQPGCEDLIISVGELSYAVDQPGGPLRGQVLLLNTAPAPAPLAATLYQLVLPGEEVAGVQDASAPRRLLLLQPGRSLAEQPWAGGWAAWRQALASGLAPAQAHPADSPPGPPAPAVVYTGKLACVDGQGQAADVIPGVGGLQQDPWAGGVAPPGRPGSLRCSLQGLDADSAAGPGSASPVHAALKRTAASLGDGASSSGGGGEGWRARGRPRGRCLPPMVHVVVALRNASSGAGASPACHSEPTPLRLQLPTATGLAGAAGTQSWQ